MSIKNKEAREWLFYASEGHFEITPAVRYPSDDQTPVTREDALRYAEAANEVYTWVIQKYSNR